MATLVWDALNAKQYQMGVRRGVFYPQSGSGVPWNGLLSVDEGFVGGEEDELFLDGLPFLQSVRDRNYQARVSAFSSPPGFLNCVGKKSIMPGVYLDHQPKRTFNFCYQTGVNESDYKIHLVYNVTATREASSQSTISDSVEVSQASWTFNAAPTSRVSGQRPTAHLIVDSQKAAGSRLTTLEQYIYGTASTLPLFPSYGYMVALFYS